MLPICTENVIAINVYVEIACCICITIGTKIVIHQLTALYFKFSMQIFPPSFSLPPFHGVPTWPQFGCQYIMYCGTADSIISWDFPSPRFFNEIRLWDRVIWYHFISFYVITWNQRLQSHIKRRDSMIHQLLSVSFKWNVQCHLLDMLFNKYFMTQDKNYR